MTTRHTTAATIGQAGLSNIRDAGDHASERQRDPRALLALAGKIARAGAPEDPPAISMRAFNRSRNPSGHPSAPTAEAIHQRFNQQLPKASWREIMRVACSDADPGQWIGFRERTSPRRDVTDEDCSYALRVVCR